VKKASIVNKTINKTLVTGVSRSAARVISNADPLAVIIEALDYLKVREQEKTKRIHIRAKRDVLVHAINAEREAILQYFEQRFAERRAALEQFYQLLHAGVAAADTSSIDTALTGILGILQDNPLRDFATFKEQIKRRDFFLDL
jgi:hypothetical protein